MTVTDITRRQIPFAIGPRFLSCIQWYTEDGRIFHQGMAPGNRAAVYEQVGAGLQPVRDADLLRKLDRAGKAYKADAKVRLRQELKEIMLTPPNKSE